MFLFNLLVGAVKLLAIDRIELEIGIGRGIGEEFRGGLLSQVLSLVQV